MKTLTFAAPTRCAKALLVTLNIDAHVDDEILGTSGVGRTPVPVPDSMSAFFQCFELTFEWAEEGEPTCEAWFAYTDSQGGRATQRIGIIHTSNRYTWTWRSQDDKNTGACS